MPGVHSSFGPSKANRIIECPASYRDDALYTGTTRFEAAQGTAAHTLADRILTRGGVASMFIGEIIEVEGHKIEVDDEMAEAVTRYIAWVSLQAGDHHTEQRVDISPWCPLPGQFGTSDHAVCAPGRLSITELKFGKGVRVFAEESYQGILYALGFVNEWDWLYDFQKVRIRICQPRLDHFDEWDTTKAHLLEVGVYIKKRFALALTPDAPYGPSEKACKFCKASGLCKAQEQFLNSHNALAFDVIDGEFERPGNVLTVDELVAAWRVRKLYEMRLNEIERRLMELMMHGETVPGLKAVEGKAHRRWKNEAEARAFLIGKLQLLEDKIAPRKLISASKVEKMMPPSVRQSLAEFWFRPPGRPTLADARDKRSPYEVKSLAAFDVVGDAQESEDE